jgi:hypothetical protein
MKYIILLLIFVIFIIIGYNVNENYGNRYILPDKWNLQIPNIETDNTQKPWAEIAVGYNNNYVMDVPHQIQDNLIQDTITILAKYPIIKVILDKMKERRDISKYEKKKMRFNEILNYNKMTWKNRLDNFLSFYQKSEFPTLHSCFEKLNGALNVFLLKLNNEYNNHPSEKIIPDYFGKKGFEIFKYRIMSIYENGDSKLYKIVIVLYKENATNMIYIYLEIYDDGKLNEYDIIGYQETDRTLTYKGKQTINNNYYKNKELYQRGSQVDQPIFTDDDFQIYYNNHFYSKSNRLEHTYACFNANPNFFKLTRGTEQNIIIPQYNKFECESDYDNVGRKKVKGYWDKKCMKDEECPFYESNKNYPNKRGGCIRKTGYCELPEGMQHMGYRSYINPSEYSEYKPLCYNCKSKDEWKALSKLGQCCEEQKDRKKYPNLKTPDYVFEGDIHDRMQAKEYNNYIINLKKILGL